ncbi:MAG TPA: rhomboid family intramembrane serine protease [Thermomicrobiales bacterium]|nr:rhomboid family intramembrane serine protease [Thermomicrobiales bacterium]
MLPISDDNRGRRSQPYVVWTLIAINVVIFAYEFVLDQHALNDLFARWAVIPAEVSSGHLLYTLVTCAFLHGSWLHLGGNMLFLWIFGDNVEDVMGHTRFLIYYLLTAIIASAAQVLVNPDSTTPLVGASGAISGVLAAYIVMFPRGRIRTLVFLGVFFTAIMVPAWLMIGYWILLQLLSGLSTLGVDDVSGGVAFFAHIGGFIGGLALVGLFRDRGRLERQRTRRRTYDGQSWRQG